MSELISYDDLVVASPFSGQAMGSPIASCYGTEVGKIYSDIRTDSAHWKFELHFANLDLRSNQLIGYKRNWFALRNSTHCRNGERTERVNFLSKIFG